MEFTNSIFQQVASQTNFLVRDGLVDVNLYDVCIPPIATDLQSSSNNKECNARRNMWQDCRLLTGHKNNYNFVVIKQKKR